jgi:hypothetical protein
MQVAETPPDGRPPPAPELAPELAPPPAPLEPPLDPWEPPLLEPDPPGAVVDDPPQAGTAAATRSGRKEIVSPERATGPRAVRRRMGGRFRDAGKRLTGATKKADGRG